MTVPVNTSTNITDLSNGNSAGTRLGQTTTDLISFYGSTPIVQPAGNAGAVVQRGAGGAMVCTFSVTASPASVATLTTAEVGITPIGGTGATVSIATTDLVLATKPTAQAGIWMGNVRASAANVAGVTFGNMTSGFLTPTGSETYGVVALKTTGITITTLLTPTSIAARTTAEQQFTVTGLRAGECVMVNKPTAQAGLDILGYRVVSNNLLGITFANVTSATVITPTAAESYTVVCLGGLTAGSNLLGYQVTTASTISVGVTAAATGAYNLTLTNAALTDSFISWQKPTNQSGINVAGGKISSAGVVNVYIGNQTSATVITPTANEVVSVFLDRPAPVAPMVLYTTTITPASVATLTSAEQTFAVTGLISISPVVVNGPAQPAGVGIGGVRVSSTNNVGINFVNLTSATALTPTAGTYYVANFQMPIDAPGNSILQSANLISDQIAVLANSMGTALKNLGLISGA